MANLYLVKKKKLNIKISNDIAKRLIGLFPREQSFEDYHEYSAILEPYILKIKLKSKYATKEEKEVIRKILEEYEKNPDCSIEVVYGVIG